MTNPGVVFDKYLCVRWRRIFRSSTKNPLLLTLRTGIFECRRWGPDAGAGSGVRVAEPCSHLAGGVNKFLNLFVGPFQERKFDRARIRYVDPLHPLLAGT